MNEIVLFFNQRKNTIKESKIAFVHRRGKEKHKAKLVSPPYYNQLVALLAFMLINTYYVHI
jgi:hypothetical protein